MSKREHLAPAPHRLTSRLRWHPIAELVEPLMRRRTPTALSTCINMLTTARDRLPTAFAFGDASQRREAKESSRRPGSEPPSR